MFKFCQLRKEQAISPASIKPTTKIKLWDLYLQNHCEYYYSSVTITIHLYAVMVSDFLSSTAMRK